MIAPIRSPDSAHLRSMDRQATLLSFSYATFASASQIALHILSQSA